MGTSAFEKGLQDGFVMRLLQSTTFTLTQRKRRATAVQRWKWVEKEIRKFFISKASLTPNTDVI